MIARLIVFATVAATASTWAAQTTAAPAATVVAPVTEPAKQPFAVQFDLPSKITGRAYRIYVAKPSSAPPKGGWPVIYVLDADVTFATASSQTMLRDLVGSRGAIVVGIGYPQARGTFKLREFDLTPSAPLPGTKDEPGAKPQDFGGASLFHRFMIEELRPQIAAICASRQCQPVADRIFAGRAVRAWRAVRSS